MKIEKQEKIIKQQNEKEVEQQKIKERQERERIRKAMRERLKREKRANSAVRMSRQREAELYNIKVKLDKRMSKIEENERNKEKERNVLMNKEKFYENQKIEVQQKIDDLKKFNKTTNEIFLQQIASKFDINLDDLKKKMQEKKLEKHPPQISARLSANNNNNLPLLSNRANQNSNVKKKLSFLQKMM